MTRSLNVTWEDPLAAQVGEGLAVFECEPGEQHYNPIGVVDGGLAMTLLDSAMGCCVHTRLAPGTGYATLEAKVNMGARSPRRPAPSAPLAR